MPLFKERNYIMYQRILQNSSNGGTKRSPLTYEYKQITTSANTPFTETCSKKPIFIIKTSYFYDSTKSTYVYDVEYDKCTYIETMQPSNNIGIISDTEYQFNAGSSRSTTHIILFVIEE